MSQVKFSVQLFDTNALAADGSNIPRRSCEAYLTSPEYAISIRDKVAIGGSTHKDRRLRPELKGLVGMDDQVLINDNALFYITKLYFKSGSDFLFADAETFDPDLFAGKRSENIKNLIGMLLSGVRMPVSVVIQALWSKRGVAEKIIRIKGFDFTQNPSFKGARMVGDIQVFSDTMNIDDLKLSDEDTEMYSDRLQSGDLEFKSVIYSTEGSVIIDESDNNSTQENLSYSEVVNKYGLFSDEATRMRSKANDHDGQSEIDYWVNYVNQLGQSGDTEAQQILFRPSRDRIINIIRSVPADDPNKSELIKARLDQFFSVQPNQQYSTSSTIASRMVDVDQPRYTRINQLLVSYKQQYNQIKTKLTDEKLLKMKLMFIQDINLLIKEVTGELYKGMTLNTLFGMNRYGKDIQKASIDYSKTYRKLLISENVMKFIPKAIYGEWIMDSQKFYQELMKFVFDQGLSEFEINLVDFKSPVNK